ncbi:MAG: hypothetical protein GF311_22445 [Candidatus Lokiarchaeota archaeon]|nr:hypothetical protein [Candidatus Lokiarchaeota archaeon]
MEEPISYYDWEKGTYHHKNEQKSELAEIGVEKAELKEFLSTWTKRNLKKE